MNSCAKYSEYVIPSIECASSNQANYTRNINALSSQIIGNFTNLYLKEPIKKLIKSSNFWTQCSECSSFELVDEYKSFLGSTSSNNIVISPEIVKYNKEHSINNTYFNEFLNDVLLEIISLLDSTKIKSININIETVKDLEFPNWEEFVITIKLPFEVTDYDEYFNLWEEIGEHVKEKIASIKVKDIRILKRYGNPVILLEGPI